MREIKCQAACKPGSVHRRRIPCGTRGRMGDHSSRTALTDGLKQPTRATGQKHALRLASRAAPIRSCSRWGLPRRPPLPGARCALTAPFHCSPRRSFRAEALGDLLSVALSLTPKGAAGRYPAPLFRGARTFLAGASTAAIARPPGEGGIGCGEREVIPDEDCSSPSKLGKEQGVTWRHSP